MRTSHQIWPKLGSKGAKFFGMYGEGKISVFPHVCVLKMLGISREIQKCMKNMTFFSYPRPASIGPPEGKFLSKAPPICVQNDQVYVLGYLGPQTPPPPSPTRTPPLPQPPLRAQKVGGGGSVSGLSHAAPHGGHLLTWHLHSGAPSVSFWLKTWIWQGHCVGSGMARVE